MKSEIKRFRNFIERQFWTFAKSYAKTSPHEYIVKGKLSSEDQQLFEDFVLFIRKHGTRKKYKKTFYVHFDLDGWSYWTMGAPLAITIIINRHQLGFYDLISETYDRLFTEAELTQENLEVAAALADSVRGKVLDIGCGTGLMLDLFPLETSGSYDYLGIDPSGKMLERLHQKHSSAATLQTTFEEFSSKSKFDLIVALFGAVSYINPASLEKIEKLRKRSGKYFLMFYDRGYFPVTYQKTGICFSHYATDPAQLTAHFGETFRYSHYLIATNIEKASENIFKTKCLRRGA